MSRIKHSTVTKTRVERMMPTTKKIEKNLHYISSLQHLCPYCFFLTFLLPNPSGSGSSPKEDTTNKFGSDFNTLRSIHRTDHLETSEQKLMFMSTDDKQDSLSIKKAMKESQLCLPKIWMTSVH